MDRGLSGDPGEPMTRLAAAEAVDGSVTVTDIEESPRGRSWATARLGASVGRGCQI